MHSAWAFFYLGLPLASAVHEAGHLLDGWVAGMPIRLCCVGLGPLLLRARIQETWLELRLIPLTGFVQAYPIISPDKLPRAVLILGGVTGNIVAFAFLAALDSMHGLTFLPPGAGKALGFAQIVLLLNLVPFSSRRNGRRIASDGLRLLKLLARTGRDEMAVADGYLEALRSYDGAVDGATLRSAAAPMIAYWIARRLRWTDRQGWRNS